MKTIIITLGLLLGSSATAGAGKAAFKVAVWSRDARRADTLFAAKDYLGAARIYAKIARGIPTSDPYRGKVLFNAAVAFQSAGVRDRARDLLTAVVEQHPKDSAADAALFSLAQLHLLVADHQAAARLLLRLDAQYPKSRYGQDALLEAALLLEAMNRKPEAVKALGRWVARYGRRAAMGHRAALHRCTLLSRGAAKCYAKWLKQHRRASFEEHAKALVALADAHKAGGKQRKATKALKQVLALAGSTAERPPWTAEARLRLARWKVKGHTFCDVLASRHSGAASEALAEMAMGNGADCVRPGADPTLLLSKLRGRVGWVSAPTLRRLQRTFPEDFPDVALKRYVRTPKGTTLPF